MEVLESLSFHDEMDVVGEVGRGSFANDGLFVGKGRSFSFSFHCLTMFALQGREAQPKVQNL